jgi:hypothetical protein
LEATLTIAVGETIVVGESKVGFQHRADVHQGRTQQTEDAIHGNVMSIAEIPIWHEGVSLGTLSIETRILLLLDTRLSRDDPATSFGKALRAQKTRVKRPNSSVCGHSKASISGGIVRPMRDCLVEIDQLGVVIGRCAP